MRKVGSRLIFLLPGLVFALLISELVLRLFWQPPYLDPKYKRDDLFWMSENVVLNNYGLRDDDVVITKSPDTFRIYSLGDSFTYGWYINDPNLSYPNVLEEELNQRFRETKVEVINAANPGFKINDSVERFRQEGVLFSPDIVTLGINLFDLASKEFPPQKPKFAILAKLRLYEATLGNLERNRVSKLTQEELRETLKKDSKNIEKAKEELRALNELAASIGARLILVIFPQYDPSNHNGDYSYGEFHNLMREIADDIKPDVKVVDLLPAFQNVPDKTQLVLNPTDEHPTALAHSIAADTIIKEFDFAGFFSSRKPIMSEIKQEAEGDNFVYFDRKFGLGVQEKILTNKQERRVAFMADYLKTSQTATHNGWPGAKIEANFPGGTNEISLTDILYGYPVVGVNKMTAFWRKDGSLESRDLELSELEVTKSEGGIKIKVLTRQTFDFYRITFDVGVHQLDIENAKVVSVFKTQVIFKLIEQGQTKISALASGFIGSLPTFVAEGEAAHYVWYDNRLREVKIAKEEKSLQLEFATPAVKKFEIEIPVAVELEENPEPTVIYL